jgi:hypothetical protein
LMVEGCSSSLSATCAALSNSCSAIGHLPLGGIRSVSITPFYPTRTPPADDTEFSRRPHRHSARRWASSAQSSRLAGPVARPRGQPTEQSPSRFGRRSGSRR